MKTAQRALSSRGVGVMLDFVSIPLKAGWRLLSLQLWGRLGSAETPGDNGLC